MKLSEAVVAIEKANGQHLQKIYVPSLKRFAFFHPLKTADVKLLTRMGFIDQFQLDVELLKLSLFDRLAAQDLASQGVSSQTLTMFDYLAFLIGVRQMLKNDITFSFTCRKCGQRFQQNIDLADFFDEDLEGFSPQSETFEKVDQNTNVIWKFQLANYTMQDYLYCRFVVEELKKKNPGNLNLLNDLKYLRAILYIKKIWMDGQEIQDWGSIQYPEKLAFFNQIPPSITLMETPANRTLCGFISDTFAEQKLDRKLKSTIVECDKCGQQYRGVYRFQNFFTFWGSRKTT